MKYKEPIKGKSIRKLFREKLERVVCVQNVKITLQKCEKFMIRCKSIFKDEN